MAACAVAGCYYTRTSVPYWPSIRDPELLVRDASLLMAGTPTNALITIPRTNWPTSISTMNPLSVDVYHHRFVAISIGIMPMDSGYGYMIYPEPQTGTVTWGAIPLTKSDDPRIFRFKDP